MRVRIKVSVTDERDTCQDASSINDLIEFNALDRERLGVGHFLNVASVKRACAHGAALLEPVVSLVIKAMVRLRTSADSDSQCARRTV